MTGPSLLDDLDAISQSFSDQVFATENSGYPEKDVSRAKARLNKSLQARATVAELIETLQHVEQWMENHALPTLGDDSDGGNSLLVGVQSALTRAGATS